MRQCIAPRSLGATIGSLGIAGGSSAVFRAELAAAAVAAASDDGAGADGAAAVPRDAVMESVPLDSVMEPRPQETVIEPVPRDAVMEPAAAAAGVGAPDAAPSPAPAVVAAAAGGGGERRASDDEPMLGPPVESGAPLLTSGRSFASAFGAAAAVAELPGAVAGDPPRPEVWRRSRV